MKEEVYKKINSLATSFGLTTNFTVEAVEEKVKDAEETFFLYTTINAKGYSGTIKDVWVKKYAFENLKEAFGLHLREVINSMPTNDKNFDTAYHLINSSQNEKDRLMNILY